VGSPDYFKYNGDSVIQDRLNLDGYRMYTDIIKKSGVAYTERFFDAADVFDDRRPPFNLP
jgi:hypothetical protein